MSEDRGSVPGGSPQRLDKWLWFARVAKTRTLAAGLVACGKVRVNKVKVDKPSHSVKAGDVILVSTGRSVRILKVVQPGVRRGPASEAAGLFEELTEPRRTTKPAARTSQDAEPEASADVVPPERDPGSGRPTKKDRRAIDRLRTWSG